MNAILNLTKIQKPTLPVVMPDGQTLNLLPATKALIDKMQTIKQAKQDVDALYNLASEILSCNAEKIIITSERASELDIYDVRTIFESYVEFIAKLNESPN